MENGNWVYSRRDLLKSDCHYNLLTANHVKHFRNYVELLHNFTVRDGATGEVVHPISVIAFDNQDEQATIKRNIKFVVNWDRGKSPQLRMAHIGKLYEAFLKVLESDYAIELGRYYVKFDCAEHVLNLLNAGMEVPDGARVDYGD